ncbi:MAG: hypothetical protein WDW36_005314 [Sanguina aurantia]
MSGGCGLTEEDLDDLEQASAGNRPYNTPPPSSLPASGKTAVIMCCKCKLVPAAARIRQRESICAACLELGVLHKVRTIRTHGLERNDRVLLAVSGGANSLALIRLMMLIKSSVEHRAESGKLNFEFIPAHIEEGVAWGLSSNLTAAHVEAISASASTACGGAATLIVEPLHALYEGGSEQERLSRLLTLMQKVTDQTGKEDLVQHLRGTALLRMAARLGCNKIMKGDCLDTSAMAIISAASKGQGHALPGDLHSLDWRHGPVGPCIVYPLREVTSKELVVVCRSNRIPLAMLPMLRGNMHMSINHLAATMVENLQATLPGGVFTVTRTAAHLQPFAFNTVPANRQDSSQQHHQPQSLPEPTSSPTDIGKQLLSLQLGSNTESAPAAAEDAAAATAAAVAAARLQLPVLGSWCAGGVMAAALLLSPVSSAQAAATTASAPFSTTANGAPGEEGMSFTEEAYERQLEIDGRKRQLDYMLQQSDMVTKAQLYSLRQQVEAQSSSTEASLQQKITTERANQLSAQKSGNARLAAAIGAEEQALEEQAGKARAAAAETQTKLSRQGMLERVRNLAFKQSLARGAQAAKDELNTQLDVVLEAGLSEGLVAPKAAAAAVAVMAQ